MSNDEGKADLEEFGSNLFDDLARIWRRRFKFRLTAFNPWCLTIIKKISNDPLIGARLKHYAVKFPLPGIPGVRDGEATCYSTQPCIVFEVGGVVDCFFNTQDHSLRFYTSLSGHDSLKLFSYIILVVPFFFGSLCCLISASRSWRNQWTDFSEWVKSSWEDFQGYWKQGSDSKPPPNYGGSRKQHSDQDEAMRSYQQMETGTGEYQAGNAAGNASMRPSSSPVRMSGSAQGGAQMQEPGRVRSASPPRGGNFVQNNISWMRMQMGV